MWGLPGSGIEPGCPALAGGFFTTEPQEKLPNSVVVPSDWGYGPENQAVHLGLHSHDRTVGGSVAPPETPEASGAGCFGTALWEAFPFRRARWAALGM